MNWRLRPWIITACLGLGLALVLSPVACDYSSSSLPPDVGSQYDLNGSSRSSAALGGTGEVSSGASPSRGDGDPDVMRPAILESVLSLIHSAALTPGGDNFKQAISKLNTYFADVPAARFALQPEVRQYLGTHGLSEDMVRGLEQTSFGMADSRHVEDCMMYYGIATRVAGTGDDLTRVRRVFDWMVRQIQLAPAGALGQAQARPYDVLLRGMAVEAEEGWSERGWLFMSLCRQLGIDVGLLTYTAPGGSKPNSWVCAALIDGKLYLFDPRLGLAIPGPGGEGVATLEEALSDPAVLGRLDLPGQAAYRPDLSLLKQSKIGILMDSSPGYLSPRMLLLQESLSGKNRTILHRNLLDQRDRFEQALGKDSDGVKLWPLPLLVETMLFTSGEFVQATLQSLYLFRPEFPLLYARIKQLRGELPEAITDYMNLRVAEVPLMMDKKTLIPPEIQQALVIHATYFLALDHLEQGNPRQADLFFTRTLQLLPAPGPGLPYYHMFRWGAQTNLGLLNEAKGDDARAIMYFSERDPTMQHQGNLVRARELVWRDPTAALPAPLPPPPAPPAVPPAMLTPVGP